MIATTEPTRYEIAIQHTDGRAFLLSYSPRRSLRGLVAACANKAETIREVTGLPATAEFDFATKPRPEAKHGDWWIGFTGRTQREIKNSGGRERELPFIGAARAA